VTTTGIGTQTSGQVLTTLSDMTKTLRPIQPEEHLVRIANAQAYMQTQNIDAIYLNAGTNLTYFTGMKWYASERMIGAILPCYWQGAIYSAIF
jgi:Xaa-Pro dipeptidase